MVTPLKLKSERVGKVALADKQPYLSVLVDTGVFHLDYEFDYGLPEKFDLKPGQWVSVPFNGRNCLGLIVKRSDKSASAKVLPINRGVKGPQVSAQHLALYRAVSERWATPIFDVLRFVTRFRGPEAESSAKLGVAKRNYLQLPPSESEITAIKKIAKKTAQSGPTLVIAPEARLAKQLEDKDYETAMRGGILSPKKYTNLIIVREDSEHHYEIKSPGFNVRDVALLRSEILKENILFLGYSPSLEMTRLIDSNFINFKKSSGAVQVHAGSSQQGEIIPSALLKEFRSALAKGRVLVIAPSKGYGLAISCAACRNIAKCKCGGKLSKSSKNAPAFCVICASSYPDWRCSYCKGSRIYLLGRGIERIAEDFGRAFPNAAIHIATADKEIDGQIPKQSIVLATVGAAPIMEYSVVLFLEGLNFGADLRNEERFLSTIFRYSAYANGKVLIVERNEHPAINALIRWNSLPYLRRTIAGLKEVSLPPYVRHILIKSDEADRIYSGLLTAMRDGRLVNNIKIHNIGNGVISLFFPLKNAKSVLTFLFELQKRRSISGKGPLKLRVDPYLLG